MPRTALAVQSMRFVCPKCGNAVVIQADCEPRDVKGWCSSRHVRPVAMVRQEKP